MNAKELYQRKPRLYQVALELSKFDDPYKALDSGAKVQAALNPPFDIAILIVPTSRKAQGHK